MTGWGVFPHFFFEVTLALFERCFILLERRVGWEVFDHRSAVLLDFLETGFFCGAQVEVALVISASRPYRDTRRSSGRSRCAPRRACGTAGG
jgi:uncharacterized membrane protein